MVSDREGEVTMLLVIGSLWHPEDWDWTRVGEVAAVLLVIAGVALFVLCVYMSLGSLWNGAALTAAYDFVLLALLGLAAVDYIRRAPFDVPRSVGSLPTPVIWFGLLGGVMISLSGVTQYTARGTWSNNWMLWHVLHPFVGAVCGIIAVLIFQAGILSVAGQAANNAGPAVIASKSATSGNLALYLIAFVVAYREATFRELIKRLVDTILSTGSTALTITGITPPSGTGGTDVSITGSGLSKVTEVKFGVVVVEPTAKTDTYLLVTAPNQTAAVLGNTDKPLPVTVTAADSSAAGTFTYTAPPADG